jgi:hypothetical protein
MDEVVKRDILHVLADTIEILQVEEERDVIDLRELSNHTIHNASIFQDEDSVSLAILIYSLSKIIERRAGKVSYKNLLAPLIEARKDLMDNKTEAYRKGIKKLFNFISSIDTKLKLYVEQVINQAEIKKGSKLYAHGISLARAAEILGISQWELMFYVGKTNLTDIKGGVSVKDRLNYARSLFK